MRIIITGMNFRFNDGYDYPYTSVNFSFRSSGSTISTSGSVNIDNQTYENTGMANMIPLIKDMLSSAITINKNVMISSIYFSYDGIDTGIYNNASINIESYDDFSNGDITYNIGGHIDVNKDSYKDLDNEPEALRDYIINTIVGEIDNTVA